MSRSGGMRTTARTLPQTSTIIPSYSIYALSLSPTTFNASQIAAGATLNINGIALTNITGNYWIQYHIEALDSSGPIDIPINTNVNLIANVPFPVNISTSLPNTMAVYNYRVDALFYTSGFANLLYMFNVLDFSVTGSPPPASVAVVTGAQTGAYEVWTNPVTFAPNTTINIFGHVTANVTGSYAVEYNILEINNGNSTNIVVNTVASFTADVPLLVNLSVLVPVTVPVGTYRIDVLIYTPDFVTNLLYVQQANIFYVQSAAITTLAYKIGVYRAAQDPTAILVYENYLGRRMDYILDTIPSGDWGDATIAISFAKFVGSGWNFFASQWVGNESRMVITCPMLPVQGNYGSPTLGSGGASTALAAGASGSYDSYWTTLGSSMVSSGFGSNYIRLGWEMNGNWYNWSASFNPTAWVTYFQRIVTILRATSGSSFKFVFNPTLGYQTIDSSTIYPGDSYVDVIALDIYDQDFNGYYPILSTDTTAQALVKQQAVWANTLDNPYNPLEIPYWKTFSTTHTKPLWVCEWGVQAITNANGGGDDTYFIQQMHDYAVTNGIATMMYFDLFGDQALFNSRQTPTAFPNASALYHSLFGPTGS